MGGSRVQPAATTSTSEISVQGSAIQQGMNSREIFVNSLTTIRETFQSNLEFLKILIRILKSLNLWALVVL